MRLTFLCAGIALILSVPITAAQKSSAKQRLGPESVDQRQHGEYLVTAVMMCGDCHTQNDKTRFLRGGTLSIVPKKESKEWADTAPDITTLGLAGKWSEEAMSKFLMTGIDPDGKKARPPMPAFRLNSSDARAVYQYLHSLPGSEANSGK